MKILNHDSNWHIKKKLEILKKYPEVKNITKPYPLSFFYILGLILIQFSLSYFVQIFDLSILDIFLLSFVNANTFLHSISTFIHENSHGLIFGDGYRYFVSFFLELGTMGFGTHVNYEITHRRNHHTNLNIKDIDSECANEIHISNNKDLFENVYLNRIFYIVDLFPLGVFIMKALIDNKITDNKKEKIDELKSNFSINFADKIFKIFLALFSTVIVLYFLFIGWYKFLLFRIWTASIYSGKFSIMRRGQSISEHKANEYNFDIPTISSYSKISNILFFNAGYHDEHHTFPNVPWIHLPKLKEIAPEYFTNENKESYFQLWHQWYDSDFEADFYRKCK